MAEKHFYASFSLRPVIDGGGLVEDLCSWSDDHLQKSPEVEFSIWLHVALDSHANTFFSR